MFGIDLEFDRSCNPYIEFSDVSSFAESSFEEGEAERWKALRNSVPFRRGINLGLFSEKPSCILLFGRKFSLVAQVRAFVLTSVVGFLPFQYASVTCLFIPRRQQCHLDIDLLCASLGLSTHNVKFAVLRSLLAVAASSSFPAAHSLRL